MPSKQVEDVYNAGGFDGGPIGRPGRKGEVGNQRSKAAAITQEMLDHNLLPNGAQIFVAEGQSYGRILGIVMRWRDGVEEREVICEVLQSLYTPRVAVAALAARMIRSDDSARMQDMEQADG